MNFAHFEEGHHERLFVVRAISAYKACFSRIYTETFKPSRKVSVRENSTVGLPLPASEAFYPYKQCFLYSCSHSSLIIKHSPPATMTYGHFYDSTPSILDKRLHCSTCLFGTPTAPLPWFRHQRGIQTDISNTKPRCVMKLVLLPVKQVAEMGLGDL